MEVAHWSPPGIGLLKEVPCDQYENVALLIEAYDPPRPSTYPNVALLRELAAGHETISMLHTPSSSERDIEEEQEKEERELLRIKIQQESLERERKEKEEQQRLEKERQQREEEAKKVTELARQRAEEEAEAELVRLEIARAKKVQKELEEQEQERLREHKEKVEKEQQIRQMEEEKEQEKQRLAKQREEEEKKQKEDEEKQKEMEKQKEKEKEQEQKRAEAEESKEENTCEEEPVRDGLAKTVQEEKAAAGGGCEGVRVLRESKSLRSFKDMATGSQVTIRPLDGLVEIGVNGWNTCSSEIMIRGNDMSIPNGSKWVLSHDSAKLIYQVAEEAGVQVHVRQSPLLEHIPPRDTAVPLVRQKEYIKRHKVHLLLGTALDQCLKEMPPDPYFFIASALLRQVSKYPVAPRRPLGAWESFPECRIASLESEVRKLQQCLSQTRVEHELEREVVDLREQVTRMSQRPTSAPVHAFGSL